MSGNPAPLPASRFRDAITAGDAPAAESAARGLLSDGMPLLRLYEHLTDALEHVGECWELGEMTVAQEHRATAAARRVVARLRGAPPHAVRGTVLLTTLEGEQHTLGIDVLEHLFEVARFRAVAVGDVPVADLLEMVSRTTALRAVIVSAHLPVAAGALRKTVMAIRRAAPMTQVIVGGPAFVASPMPAQNTYGAHAIRLTARDALAAVNDIATPLTRRETEVLELLAEGLTNNDIATALAVSPQTVKDHVDSVMSKLRAASRTGAVAEAFRTGLLG
jgi:DNA-binding NarL/FixJ family response regulator